MATAVIPQLRSTQLTGLNQSSLTETSEFQVSKAFKNQVFPCLPHIFHGFVRSCSIIFQRLCNWPQTNCAPSAPSRTVLCRSPASFLEATCHPASPRDYLDVHQANIDTFTIHCTFTILFNVYIPIILHINKYIYIYIYYVNHIGSGDTCTCTSRSSIAT